MKNTVGFRIRSYREKCNLSQKDLGRLIGVSNTRISNWEKGINNPDVELLVKICYALKVSPDVLLDVHLKEEEFTEHEKELIFHYRHKIEMQNAVDKLLGVDDDKNSEINV